MANQTSYMEPSEWRRVVFVVAGIVVTSAGHYLTPPNLFLWHSIFQRLYYLPIVYAGIAFGWKGGLIAAIGSCTAYSPHILMAWGDSPNAMNQYSELLVFLLVGVGSGIFSDRERKREMLLQRTSEELEKVNRELQESFEQLRRADRLSAIGKLSASLAHEIRNPLASIEGAIKILQRSGLQEEIRDEFSGIAQKECQRLNRLLTNLLEFARPVPPAYREVNIGTVVDSVITLAGTTAVKKEITFKRSISPDLPRCLCDPEQMTQVLLNLTLHAIQSMPDGGEIAFDVGKFGESVLVQVKDQGVGIETPDLERIFDPFFTTKEGGTGLGLPIAYQIVAQHGGAIKVARNADKGMTFSIVLPLPRQRRTS